MGNTEMLQLFQESLPNVVGCGGSRLPCLLLLYITSLPGVYLEESDTYYPIEVLLNCDSPYRS